MCIQLAHDCDQDVTMKIDSAQITNVCKVGWQYMRVTQDSEKSPVSRSGGLIFSILAFHQDKQNCL